MAAFAIERGPDGQLRPSGRIDYANATQALADGERLAPSGDAGRAVDLAALESSDTVTLSVLIAWTARAAHRGVRLCYVNLSEDLAALVHLCDVEPLLQAA